MKKGFIKIIDDTRELLKEIKNSSADRDKLEELQKNCISGVLEFTSKEIAKMPKEFRRHFKSGGVIVHARKKPNGVIELRCQINKQKIAVSSKSLDTAKEKFIIALNELNNARNGTITKNITLCDYMSQWLETVKKPHVKESTFADYALTFNVHIKPAFKERKLIDIKSFDLQNLINSYCEKGKHRTAKKIYQLLQSLFQYAVADEIINVSPMQKVILSRYEQNHGTSLTREEEKQIIDLFTSSNNPYCQAYIFILYTGIRRSELNSVIVTDEWVTVTTAKQRKGLKEKQRSIPISPMLKTHIKNIDIELIKGFSPYSLTDKFRRLVPNHHLHELRHTFITRCQECGIQREIVSLWAGHTADSSMTSTVYTHLEQYKEKQLEEIKKFNYKL